jgi:hypothetical protein
MQKRWLWHEQYTFEVPRSLAAILCGCVIEGPRKKPINKGGTLQCCFSEPQLLLRSGGVRGRFPRFTLNKTRNMSCVSPAQVGRWLPTTR